jgi:hypothetical protein
MSIVDDGIERHSKVLFKRTYYGLNRAMSITGKNKSSRRKCHESIVGGGGVLTREGFEEAIKIGVDEAMQGWKKLTK